MAVISGRRLAIIFLSFAVPIILVLMLFIMFVLMSISFHTPETFAIRKAVFVDLRDMRPLPNYNYIKYEDNGFVMKKIIFAQLGSIKRASANAGTCCVSSAVQPNLHMHYDISISNSSIMSMFNRIEHQWNEASGASVFCGDSCRHIRPTAGIERNSRNQITFGELIVEGEDTNSILAVTALWYVCSNRLNNVMYCPTELEIIEWDMVFNIKHHNICNASLNSECYDTETVGLHEFGHVMGLDDLYQNCEQSTMWGWISKGEISRTIDDQTKICINIHPSQISSCSVFSWDIF